jgi:predicted dehydrogenase
MNRRAVLVGCGNMGANWLRALADSAVADRVAIVGLVDVDQDTAERLKAEFALSSAPVSSNLEALLAELRPEIVFDVAVPDARLDIVRTAFKYGCHVLTEKPMATSIEDAREINSLAAATGRLHAVTQNRRFNEGVRRVRAVIDSGELGRITALHCDFFIGAHFGGFRDTMDHVLLLDMAIHAFDASRYMTGQEPVAVYCHETNPAGSWYADGAAANAIFEFTDDIVMSYRGSWCAEGANTAWDCSWRVIGTKGTVLWDGLEEISTNVVVDGEKCFLRPLMPIEVPPPRDEIETRGHASVIAGFLDALDTGGVPETSGSDNIKSLAMVFGAIESARTRRRIEIAV